jgi:hypothetical protein
LSRAFRKGDDFAQSEVWLFLCLDVPLTLTMGVLMDIYDEEPAEVAADIICLNCDRPATSKVNGTAGHSHDRHPCPWCHATLLDVNKIDGYNYSEQSFLL